MGVGHGECRFLNITILLENRKTYNRELRIFLFLCSFHEYLPRLPDEI